MVATKSGHPLSGIVADATITVGSESSNSINVDVQCVDMAGDNVAEVCVLDCYLSDDSGGDGLVSTAPDGDIAIGTDGTILFEPVTDKAFKIQTESDGSFDIDIGESGAGTFHLAVVLADGTVKMSGAITFAA